MFPKNEGPADRAIRLAAGVVLLPVGLWLLGGVEASVAGIVVAAVGFIGLFTGLTGRCLLYVPFGINTLPARQSAVAAH